MKVKMALEDLDTTEANKLTDAYFRAKGDAVEELSIEKVARRDSVLRHQEDASGSMRRPSPLFTLMSSSLRSGSDGDGEVEMPERKGALSPKLGNLRQLRSSIAIGDLGNELVCLALSLLCNLTRGFFLPRFLVRCADARHHGLGVSAHVGRPNGRAEGEPRRVLEAHEPQVVLRGDHRRRVARETAIRLVR